MGPWNLCKARKMDGYGHEPGTGFPSAAKSTSTTATLCGKVPDDRSEPTAVLSSLTAASLPPGPAGQAGTAGILASLTPPRASARNYKEHQFETCLPGLGSTPFGFRQRWTPGSLTGPYRLKFFRQERHLAYPLSELSQERVFT